MFYKILDRAMGLGASDIHLRVGSRPVLRINKDLVFLENMPKIGQTQAQEIIKQLLRGGGQTLKDRDSLDFSLSYRDYRLRVHVFKELKGPSISLRLIDKKIRGLEELGLPSSLKNIMDYSWGLVLITGATGSGKSTTLASIIENINRNRAKNIISIEDPIEYVYQEKKSLIRQRQIGRDVEDFKSSIRDLVRQDPDIIVLGELRDLDSIRSCLSLADLGHLVLASLHTGSVEESIDRIINMFSRQEERKIRLELSRVLRMVVSQQLVKSLQGGLVPLVEIMVSNLATANIIRRGGQLSRLSEQIRMSGHLGSRSRQKSIEELREKGIIS